MPVPLPTGTRLLHIGPPKTGTTTLQSAFHNNRTALLEHGVHYAGDRQQARLAALAAVEQKPLPGMPPGTLQRWPELVREVRNSKADRVVISSETFANADDDRIEAIVAALGEDTHVVITLRPLVKLLPSQWQQYVQVGLRTSYEDWLDAMFNHADTSAMTPRFWRRHRHDELATRWAAAAGADRVTVVALDESDRTMNLRSFERLLDLPEDALVPVEQMNRSFSLPEVELIRALNVQYQERGWPKAVYERVLRFGMDDELKKHQLTGDEPAIRTPAWALRRADETAAEIIEGLAASGVHIIGDLSSLRPPVGDGPEHAPTASHVDVHTAARALIGVLEHTVIDPGPQTIALNERVVEDVLKEQTAGQLLRVVGSRVGRRLRPRRPSA